MVLNRFMSKKFTIRHPLTAFVMACFLAGLAGASYGQQTSTAETRPDYMLAPGDVISVQVFNEPELSVDNLRIPGSGMISYPLLGRIDTENHSVATLEKHLTALLLNGYLKKPEVSISIANYRPFFVKGDVKNPGQHNYAEGMTLEQALTIAGSSTRIGENTEISINRFNGETVQVKEVTYPISPGDVITVKRDVITEAEESTNYVYLYGEVSKPGGYEFRSGLTVEKVVAMAGGFTPRASKRKIDISRYEEGEGPSTLEGVKLTSEILPGDVVTVGESWF